MMQHYKEFNYIEYLVKQYVKLSASDNFTLQERKDLQDHILLELFPKFGYIYSSDGECDIFSS